MTFYSTYTTNQDETLQIVVYKQTIWPIEERHHTKIHQRQESSRETQIHISDNRGQK